MKKINTLQLLTAWPKRFASNLMAKGFSLSIVKHTKLKGLGLIILCQLSIACKTNYSFSGTTLASDLKTIAIKNCVMSTAGGPANFSILFTEKFKDYYTKNTNLKLRNLDADLVLETNVVGYDMTPVSATSGDKAAANRLTLRVEVRFTNNKKEDDGFEKEFSFYQDFPQEQTLTQAEGAILPKIMDQIVLDVFNATAAQW